MRSSGSGRTAAAAGLAVVLACGAASSPAQTCPRPRELVERVVPADCGPCWAGDAKAALPAGALAIDWIARAAGDAPMAAAALREAAERAGGRVARGTTTLRRSALASSGVPSLQVDHGLAWRGYIALRLVVTRHGPWRDGLRGFVALVERVPAGAEGTRIERRLVRAVAGPLVLDELRDQGSVEHLRAVSLPDTAQPERLGSVAWVETREGRVVAATASPCP